MKKNFYIFLDFDGVMTDWQFRKNFDDCYDPIIKTFKPESVNALNYLINKLEEKFNVSLVITSTLRNNLYKAEQVLKDNHVNSNCFVDKIGFNHLPSNRGREIYDYLKEKNEKQNFVIIDDQWFDYRDLFDTNKIIKTHIFENALNHIQVKKFLDVMNESKQLSQTM